MRMNLKEYQEKHGIKRIDFNKFSRNGLSECGDDELICPYCQHNFEFESEDIESIMNGISYQCPKCEKYFYVTGEMSINTYCSSMEDAVIENEKYIMSCYKHIDELEERGFNFVMGGLYGFLEWEVYKDYAKPLFENQEMKRKEGKDEV